MNGLENQLFQLKFTAKQLNKQSKRAEKEETLEKNKVKKAIQAGNMEGANIYAANAIRKKNEALNLLKLSAKIDAVASRVQTAVTMNKVTNSIAQSVKGMSRITESMDLEKISMVMDKFEKQLEDLDVQTGLMENVTTGPVAADDEANALVQQVAEEHGLEINNALDVLEPSKVLNEPKQKEKGEEDRLLTERLKALRQ